MHYPETLILWIESVSVTYWRHSTAVCVLMEGITHLQLRTHPPSYLSIPYNMPSVILQLLWKSYSKPSSVNINSYKTLINNYSSYTVNLAWLQPSRKDSQWVKYFKLVILEIPNVRFWLIFLKPVTYGVHIMPHHASN